MDVKTVANNSIIKLKKYDIKLPHLEAEILLSFILEKPREFILAHPEFILTSAQTKKIEKLIQQRCKGIPIAYLIGYKEFYGFNFLANKNVLIPRPESELIIEEILKLNPNNISSIIDVGTGSGCLVITLAKLLDKKIKYLGIDISQQALITAKKNAAINKITNIKFIKGDLLEPIIDKKNELLKPKLIIIANLPYLTEKQIKKSASIKKEPRLALDGGQDGLDYYRKLLEQIKKIKIKQAFILLEIDPTQKNKISSLIKNDLPQADFAIKKDLKGHSRLVILELN